MKVILIFINFFLVLVNLKNAEFSKEFHKIQLP